MRFEENHRVPKISKLFWLLVKSYNNDKTSERVFDTRGFLLAVVALEFQNNSCIFS